LSDKTVLVSFAYANSEIGTIQAVRGVRRIINEAEGRFGNKINLHIDAAQAPLWLPCQLEKIGADFLVLDAAKCCGPKGVGVLIRSHRAKISSIAFGGGQEQGLRPGTENVAGIVGAGVAIMEAQSNWQERAEKVSKVRDVGIQFLLQNIPRVILNGVKGEERLANNINISVLGLDTEYATVVLDNKGFAVSTKSACAGAGGGESVVVKTTSDDPARASSTLRISLGPDTTIDDLEKLTKVLSVHVKKMDSIVN
jgi:cysteine desulfurase